MLKQGLSCEGNGCKFKFNFVWFKMRNIWRNEKKKSNFDNNCIFVQKSLNSIYVRIYLLKHITSQIKKC